MLNPSLNFQHFEIQKHSSRDESKARLSRTKAWNKSTDLSRTTVAKFLVQRVRVGFGPGLCYRVMRMVVRYCMSPSLWRHVALGSGPVGCGGLISPLRCRFVTVARTKKNKKSSQSRSFPAKSVAWCDHIDTYSRVLTDFTPDELLGSPRVAHPHRIPAT